MQVKLTMTAVLFQPAVFAVGDAEPVTVGAVRSMLISLTCAPAVFPAKSAHTPLADWFAPSSDSTASGLTEAGHEVDTRQILLSEPIRQLGNYQVSVKLHRDVSVEIQVEVKRV